MAVKCQLNSNHEYDLIEKSSTDNVNNFELCHKCSTNQQTIKDWMKHLVDRHPVPDAWMSDFAQYLADDQVMKPYTTVTESRKKRKKVITPRPLNSFMIFSRHLRRNTLIFFKEASNSEISKLLGKLWNNISTPIKSLYDNEAKKLALLHSKEFPEYKYQPKKKKKCYNTKRSVDSSTPLSNDSQDSIYDQVHVRTLNGARKCASFKTDSNSFCNDKNKNIPDSKPNMLVGQNIRTSNSILRNKLSTDVKTIYKNPSVITIPNIIFDDSEGTEPSPSSFKNVLKTEAVSAISPFMNDLNSDISEAHYNNASIHDNEPATAVPSPTQYTNDFSTRFNINKYHNIFSNNIVPTINFTTPLTIVTEKIDQFNVRPVTSRTDFQLVEIFTKSNNDTLSDNVSMKQEHIQTLSNFNANKAPFDINQNSNLIESHLSRIISAHNADNVESSNSHSTNRRFTEIDPLIFDDMFDNDNTIEDDTALNINRLMVNTHSPWNLKPSTGSSIVSDREPFESHSPFHLSENDSQMTPMQKLPAIGSWLRSHHSEFLI